MTVKIPTIGEHRGVGLHAWQSEPRLAVVRAAIDAVHAMSNSGALFDFVADLKQPPEARLFAAAKCEAAWQLAAEYREARPDIDMDLLRARVVGLDSLGWIDRVHFGTALQPRPPGWRDDETKRETPLTDEQCGRGRP